MKQLYTTQKGLTIVELIVAIAIIVVTMTGFTLLFWRVWTSNSYTLETGVAALAASRGIESAVEHIRNARQAEDGSFPIVLATEDELTFYGDYDADGFSERIHYFVDGVDNKFKAGITEPNFSTTPPTYAAADETIEEVAPFIVNSVAGLKTFQYFSDNGAIYEYGDVTTEVLSEPINVQDVNMVRVLLNVNPNPGEAPENVTIQSFVTVRNLSDFDNIAP